MRLAQFIECNLTPILLEWDSFAKTLFAGKRVDLFVLRDHAHEMLLELVFAMQQTESPQQQKEKSMGAASPFLPEESAGDVHGMFRHGQGFSFSDMAAEFRALRASVLRLWLPTLSVISNQVVVDIMRFNEAIDEAMADSIATYEMQ